MSDMISDPAQTITLAQRLHSAEKSIEFIQREHASTLTNLHEEIAKWQQKCSDLTFQVAIGGGTVLTTSDDGKLQSTIKQLEREIHECKETVKHLNTLLEEKEKVIQDYKSRLLVSERNHTLDLRLETDKQRELKIELEKRSTLIAQLTNQLHREKQHQQQLQTRTRLGKVILPNKPAKLQHIDISHPIQRPPSIKHVSNRSSSLHRDHTSPETDSTKLLFVNRRAPTPPQQLRPISAKSVEFEKEQIFTNRQRQLLNDCAENTEAYRRSPTKSAIKLQPILPPIMNRNSPLKTLATTPFQQEGEV
ncbi:unnamed protein product [Adineta ricciae]|uniref:CCDC92/74 N-terminal domain-containing protein n=1 Tax=Adineta ricciae TaxID=249248 RepID=A0A815G792_ADIRI|nr:unnamed protein product [Adineta ricciae]CAF1335005.1 unnamed protein product [Adineta ricciae]